MVFGGFRFSCDFVTFSEVLRCSCLLFDDFLKQL